MRAHARRMFRAALRAVAAERLVRRAVSVQRRGVAVGGRLLELDEDGRIYVFGAGKASPGMAAGLQRVLGPRLAGGVVITKRGHRIPGLRVRQYIGSHPVSGRDSVAATRRLLEALRRVGPHDGVIFVWSGGASALMVRPRPGIRTRDKMALLARLLDSGADIREMNAVRKHLSAVKGGQLAVLLGEAPALALCISDVCGDNPATIGSGPTFPDDTSFAEAVAVLEKYRLWQGAPAGVRRLLLQGRRGALAENPRRSHAAFRACSTHLVGTSGDALEAAAAAASSLGYRPVILAAQLQGDTEAAARLHVAAARLHSRRPLCLLSGGETTVRLHGSHGRGGRNQHFVLAASLLMEEADPGAPWVVLSGGTDGTDGNTDAAGAVADSSTARRALRAGLDGRRLLERQESHRFFRGLGDLLVTGPTQTNVMDLRILLVGTAGDTRPD